MASCRECRHFKYWPATYWEPADWDCSMADAIPEEYEDIVENIFCNGESFDPHDEEHACPCFKYAPDPCYY